MSKQDNISYRILQNEQDVRELKRQELLAIQKHKLEAEKIVMQRGVIGVVRVATFIVAGLLVAVLLDVLHFYFLK